MVFAKKSRKTVGLLDGSFDPPHKGHIAFIKEALQTCDVLYVLVTNNIPHHQVHLPISERAKLLHDVINDDRVTIICGYEPLSKPHNTVSRKLYKNFYLSQFPSKTRFDKYYTNSEDKAYLAELLNAELVRISPDPSLAKISSASIRNDFARNSHLLPQAVKERYLQSINSERTVR